ncbi:MAG: DUF488 family protein [Desulfobulbaceae bacterium]|nr:DUF488 family protein [Desulfobulbaceae bacterium]
MRILVKRVYEEPAKSDGLRVLVDRLWPRGMTKEKAKVDAWWKELAPSSALRKWFGHEPAKWEEFQKRYFKELDSNPAVADFLARYQEQAVVTLLYGAKDEKHNQALLLQIYLKDKIALGPTG